MSNRISERVADFLRRYPPFNELTSRDLASLSEEVEIQYGEKGRVVFKTNEAAHPFFYVVHAGAVDLRREGTNEIVDICDEGDIFGLRPLMAGEDYKLEARVREECILYAVPLEHFRPYIQTYEEVGNFLIESFASNTRNPYSKIYAGRLLPESQSERKINPSSGQNDLIPLKASKKLVSCKPSTPVRDLARLMTKKNVGSVLIVRNKLPVGIVTDRDLRNKVATGEYPVESPAEAIMTRPVITYPVKMTITQAQLAMMKNSISHLCLTEDGTPNTPAVRIVSKHDLMLAVGNNPEVIMRAIKDVRKVKQLKAVRTRIQQLLQGYLDENIPLSISMKIISELNDACIKRIIGISILKQGNPPVSFAWMALGSQGRGEQLLLTDQDSALVFEDVAEDKREEVRTYFLKLATRITKGLKTLGYEYCPAEMMASNPAWCRSLSEWKDQVSHWVVNPGKEEVLLSSIFFDFNFTYGNSELVVELSDFIFDRVEKYPMFYYHLAIGSMQNPSPTGFFRQFLVEQDGRHKDSFDLKQRALMPLTDGARVLILSHQVKGINNTAARFEKLADLEPNNRELFLSCSYATKALLKFRTKQGLLKGDSGRFLSLETLSKEEKIKLKRTFKTIRDLQELLAVRFKVTNMPV